MFFVGALVVTAAMMHQRHLLNLNLALTDEVQVAHNRLDTLHHLSVDLGASLSVTQVTQIILDHTLRLMNERRGALWVYTDLASQLELQSLSPRARKTILSESIALTSNSATVSEAARWQLFSISGLKANAEDATLEKWKAQLEQYQQGRQAKDFSKSDGSMVPILWNGEVGAVIFVESPEPAGGDDVLLEDIALIAGPALQNALIYQTAAEHAEIDGLTGLYNHRAIQERLQQEIARVKRAKQANPNASFALVMMDVTDFKLFNDTYGHAVGDEVLRTVSDVLRSTFRTSDIVGRFGGDEFLMLLPDTPCRGSEILSSRAIEVVAAQPFVAPDGSRITIHLTCGVSCFPEDGATASELLRAADDRLYKAKRKGEFIIEQATVSTAVTTPAFKPDWSTIGLFETLIFTIDSKDHYTKTQCERAWRYALMIAHQMQLTPETIQAVHFCSLVHDVGKIVIPDAILRKPGRLTKEEFEVMQQHTVFGAMIVKDLPYLDEVLGGVRHHHEHWDGTGYPDRLCAQDIPFLARIMTVADSFSAMESQRPYRKALQEKEALAEIAEQKGKRYDPDVVDAFEQALEALAEEKISIQKILQLNQVEHLAVAEEVESAKI